MNEQERLLVEEIKSRWNAFPVKSKIWVEAKKDIFNLISIIENNNNSPDPSEQKLSNIVSFSRKNATAT